MLRRIALRNIDVRRRGSSAAGRPDAERASLRWFGNSHEGNPPGMTRRTNMAMSLALAALALSAALWTHDSMYVAAFAMSAVLLVVFLFEALRRP